ncbi:MAG: transcriptional regulator [Gallionellaceae bacterium]|nr:transcriptional regulator [Gallionellaceae bacterium]
MPVPAETLGEPVSSFYEKIKKGLIVPGIPIGARAVAFPRHEIQALAAARIAGKTDDEIRDLVKQLVADRAKAGQEGGAA